ncbi:hypothetical protein GN956_G11439 [Arapaima gigas]
MHAPFFSRALLCGSRSVGVGCPNCGTAARSLTRGGEGERGAKRMMEERFSASCGWTVQHGEVPVCTCTWPADELKGAAQTSVTLDHRKASAEAVELL